MDGGTLVLLPGLLCDASLWAPQIAAFSARIACRVADLTRHDDFGQMAQEVLDTVPGDFALAGLSMGGYVAQEIMRRAPGRIRGLALIDTSARADTAEQHDRRIALLDLVQRGRFKGVTPKLLPALIHPSRMQDGALTAVVMEMAERVGRDAFLRQQRAIMQRPDGRADLAAIRCPTLVLCGRQDVLTPLALHEEMAGLVPGAELVIVEECGHLSSLERPEPVNAALERWLARL